MPKGQHRLLYAWALPCAGREYVCSSSMPEQALGIAFKPLTTRPHSLSTHVLFKKYEVHADMPTPPSRQEGSAPMSAPALGCGVGCPCGSGGFPLGVRRGCAGSVQCTESSSGARAHTLGPVTGRPCPRFRPHASPGGNARRTPLGAWAASHWRTPRRIAPPERPPRHGSGELCLCRVKAGEALVEARSDADVHVVRHTWVQGRKTIRTM